MEIIKEQPTYVLHQKKSRAIIPKIITLILLSAIFYGGILLNLALLKLTEDLESNTKLGALILICLIILIGTLLAFLRANKPYLFYKSQIVQNKKEISYNAIAEITIKQNFLDKMFNTYSIKCSDDFYFKHISKELNLKEYLQKLINYSRSF